MPRRRFEYKVKKDSTFGLNINSMTDMFTIMLVFLLQTYSTSEVEVNPVKDIRLPASISEASAVEGVRINISPKALSFGAEEIAAISNNDFESKSLDPNDPSFIKPLFDRLQAIAKQESQKKHIQEGRILLQADESLPYSTLKKVMYTASMAGFPQLKLVTLVGE